MWTLFLISWTIIEAAVYSTEAECMEHASHVNAQVYEHEVTAICVKKREIRLDLEGHKID
jgi:hypothetical protein